MAVALSSLRTLHKVLVAAGSKSATDLQLMTDALATMATRPVTAIAASLAPKPKPVKTAKAKALDPAAIRALADELVSANHDDQRFKALLADLRARRLSKPDVTAVANKFLGVEPTRTYASSAAALQRMEDRHFHDATSASRERAINRINH